MSVWWEMWWYDMRSLWQYDDQLSWQYDVKMLWIYGFRSLWLFNNKLTGVYDVRAFNWVMSPLLLKQCMRVLWQYDDRSL